MPVIKSAIKRTRQAKKRTEANRKILSHMRSLVKNVFTWSKAGEQQKAEQTFPAAQKAIDMAAKKNLIHKNNAARRKAGITAAMKKANFSTASKIVTKKKAGEKTSSAPASAPKKKAKK